MNSVDRAFVLPPSDFIATEGPPYAASFIDQQETS